MNDEIDSIIEKLSPEVQRYILEKDLYGKIEFTDSGRIKPNIKGFGDKTESIIEKMTATCSCVCCHCKKCRKCETYHNYRDWIEISRVSLKGFMASKYEGSYMPCRFSKDPFKRNIHYINVFDVDSWPKNLYNRYIMNILKTYESN